MIYLFRFLVSKHYNLLIGDINIVNLDGKYNIIVRK